MHLCDLDQCCKIHLVELRHARIHGDAEAWTRERSDVYVDSRLAFHAVHGHLPGVVPIDGKTELSAYILPKRYSQSCTLYGCGIQPEWGLCGAGCFRG